MSYFGDELGLYIGLLSSALGLAYSFALLAKILRSNTGNEKMLSMARAIQSGAKTYSIQQLLAIFTLVALLAILVALFISPVMGISLALGALANAIVKVLSMYVSVKANVRTAEAAKVLSRGFAMAFSSGSVVGLFVSSWALMVSTLAFYILRDFDEGFSLVLGLLFFVSGSSVVSLFTRLGGGIFTKGADIGADMVGKIEKDLPEDDPRNPAVIADNVGDNVGDCVGSSADVFETYLLSLLGAVVLFSMLSGSSDSYISYLFSICGVGVIASTLGVTFTKLRGTKVLFSMYLGLIVSTLVALVGLSVITVFYQESGIIWPALAGYGTLWALALFSQYYTSFQYKPALSIAKASESGHATNVISGMSVGLEAAFVFGVILVLVFFLSQTGMGINGLGILSVSLLSLSGSVISMDSYGPISDNAGGIAEMSGMKPSVRQNTDTLDAVGNTTKAITKSYIMGSTAISIFMLLMKMYPTVTGLGGSAASIFNLLGLLLGASLPFLFSSFCMRSVGKAAAAVVDEIRRQFKADPRILKGEAAPDYAKTVAFLTRNAIKSAIVPGVLMPIIPLAVSLSISAFYPLDWDVFYMSCILGLLATGIYLSVFVTVSGGAWDNAKKYIEEGNFGGKGSLAHKAAVTGDAVGDPCKDTVGPGINPFMKLTSLIAVLCILIATS